MTTKELQQILETRFEENPHRHKSMQWKEVLERLESNEEKLKSLMEMEKSGGEPDVINFDGSTGEFIFCDCSKESPKGRRNTCYDEKGEEIRVEKGVFPEGNAVGMAKEIGVELLTENEYRDLQAIEEFDLKTSSWLKAPEEIRELGGAVFGDRRFNHVFLYHNSAHSFYSSRGFRGLLRV
ncbi:MAG: DUF4256 domain-containing protein [Clostridium sp.]|nr:DUF4256 domain-containing protein [Clostridium sp.]